jgi:hypothetical protein
MAARRWKTSQLGAFQPRSCAATDVFRSLRYLPKHMRSIPQRAKLATSSFNQTRAGRHLSAIFQVDIADDAPDTRAGIDRDPRQDRQQAKGFPAQGAHEDRHAISPDRYRQAPVTTRPDQSGKEST